MVLKPARPLVAAAALLVGALLFAACSSDSDDSSASPSRPSGLRSVAPRDLLVGAAVNNTALRDDSTYRRMLARQYNAVTPENAMKWDTIHPEEDRYDFRDADRIVDFARKHDMKVRGHTLVWYRQVPDWVNSRTWTRPELEALLHDHIRTVVHHFRGKVVAWDVVNEAIDDKGQLRDSVWSRVLGRDYIDLAFKWAHEADPDAKLFYNDYDIERPGAKSDAVEALVAGMKDRGVPIDGVGLQGHELTVRAATRAMWDEALERYSRHGLDVGVTELDVGIFMPADDKKLDEQAGIYDDVLRACLAVRRCTTFVTWGFTDRYSWIPDELPGFGDALPFDKDYRAKPAARALKARLSQGRTSSGSARG